MKVTNLTTNPKTEKIHCPTKKCFKYVEACKTNCPRAKKCKALAEYLKPKIFK